MREVKENENRITDPPSLDADAFIAHADKEMQHIIEVWKSYTGSDDASLISRAYEFAKKAHAHQKRATGEPYIIHPVAAGKILLDLQLDDNTLAAALLHDTVEDTDTTLEDIRDNFGQEVMHLVDGVTKLSRISYSSQEEEQAQNFRKMFLAMAKDIRVVLIKLADRLHNMRTMKYKDPDKQVSTARETLDIYAPLAHRLGIYKIKWELEDLSLRYLDPDAYYELVGSIAQRRGDREQYLMEIVSELSDRISDMGIDADIEGRPKHFYSIYRKMKAQKKDIDEIYDIFATRVIVPTVGDCYAVLGLVHELYKPMPGRFKDYIAMPKTNGYQSLHTTVVGSRGIPFEVQIRTDDMHYTAEYGIAAHWRYKEGKQDQKVTSIEMRLNWLRQLTEWQHDARDASEYMATLKEGLITDEVFVFTPQGDVIDLPAGAVPVDFAYHIHSDIGNSMYGAKVNGRMVPLTYELQNGDIVEILTSDKVRGPSRDWLGIIKSGTARNKISTWFKRERREENMVRGREVLEREIKNAGFTPAELLQKDVIAPALKRYSYNTLDDIYAAIGYGGLQAKRFIPRLRDAYLRTLPEEKLADMGYTITSRGQVVYNPDQILTEEKLLKGGEATVISKPKKKADFDKEIPVKVQGLDNALVKLSKCCNPVPGDAIIGFVTRGQGVAVHRMNCSNIRHILEKFDRSQEDAERAARLIDVSWIDSSAYSTYPVDIQIIARDRTRLLAEISAAIAEEHASVQSASMSSAKDISANILMTVNIENQEQFDRLVGRIKAIDSVVRVTRGHNA
ncbi:MAG: bifunctional (p)ppGpp synthetase/guanosine-3',5'-bis(diphosphate) 3'-pyrophosphohydrolase [Saccharofermentanales bacterium]|nr:bifunctional (p)ppGpp synthetase/guanosine-3',5'-bis(diphosphate) 3'-pyrophosphohydrolase [Eubacteriales bacterium]